MGGGGFFVIVLVSGLGGGVMWFDVGGCPFLNEASTLRDELVLA